MSNSRGDFLLALRDGVPLGVSVFSFGLVYGVMALQAGLSLAEGAVMSLLVFAGASQFIAVGMIGAGATASAIIITTLLVNMRHLLLGASLGQYLRKEKSTKLAVLAHFLTDESYALSILRFQQRPATAAYYLGAGLTIYVTWLMGSLLGMAMGATITNVERYGLDFVFLATFIGMVIPQIKNKNLLVVCLVAAVTSVVAALLIPGNWYIIIAALLAAAVGVVGEKNDTRNISDSAGHGHCDLSNQSTLDGAGGKG